MKTYNKLIKTIIAFIFFWAIYPNYANAQFLNKDAVWTWGFHSILNDPPGTWWLMSSKIENDTIIDGKNYSVFIASSGTYALREINNIVYYRAVESDLFGADHIERELYDFNLSVDDTFNLFYNYKDSITWNVSNIDSILLLNNYKKRIFLQEVNDGTSNNREAYWIEDIGSSYGPLWFLAISTETYLARLDCYQNNNQAVYGECTEVGINNLKKKIDLPLLYFNSEINRLHVNSNINQEKMQLNIYTLSGNKIFETLTSGNEDFVTDIFSPGLYIVEIKSKTIRFCEKILIK